MKKIITYGTFDLLHQGHINLLKRAKDLGDYLIVGVTTENYDQARGKLNVHKSTFERIEDVRKTGLVDEIIVEEFEGQKIEDICKHNVDVFAIGSDWIGKFDYLSEYCSVEYLDRTKGISSTQLRENNTSLVNFGVVGCGRIANRFIPESKFVSGTNIHSVYNPTLSKAKEFSSKHELKKYTDDFEEFLNDIDAVYIASPHLTHAEYIRKSLEGNKHVLCEKPIVLSTKELEELFFLAESKNLIFMEGIKTAYAPAFQKLITLVKSGSIGKIKDVDASFTKLTSGEVRELSADQAGGSMTELASYTLLPIIKILGTDFKKVTFTSWQKNGVDLFTKGNIIYEDASASFKVGLGVKSEGDLIISGTKGYAYVPAPWWKTEYFEIRYENLNETKKYFYKFDGDGLRFEINEFLVKIANVKKNYSHVTYQETFAIIDIIERFRTGNNVNLI